MRLPLSWLKKHISVKLSPEKLAHALTLSGTSVAGIEKHGSESVLELEITSNRPDCLSILGLAKEISALTGQKIHFPKISKRKPSKNSEFKITLEDKKGCSRYTGRLIRNVNVRPTPQEIQKFLGHCKARPISNIVDATNFVLFEMGQPLHAFDYDKIEGRVIVVRRARAGEKFLGLDGIEYNLSDKILVIADARKPIAIAGVMGGKLTEVTDRTKNILLESAYFDPILVRQGVRLCKITTESSYRFERGVNPEGVVTASERAADLILEWAGGEEVSFVDTGTFKFSKPKDIVLRVPRVEAVLGFKVSVKRIAIILKKLRFGVKTVGKINLKVTPISSRRDVVQEADLIEEILRIEGFDKVPLVIPVTRHTPDAYDDPKPHEILELKKFVAGLGFHEILTYSLCSGKSLLDSGYSEENLQCAAKIINPLSVEQEFLRPRLRVGFFQAIQYNLHRKAVSLKLFEVANRFFEGAEETVLALAIYGPFEENWRRRGDASFFDLKGIVENIARSFQWGELVWEENPPCSIYSGSLALKINGGNVGALGAVRGSVLSRWDIPKDVFIIEIVLDALIGKKRVSARAVAIPKFPSVRRDVSFFIDEKIPVQDLVRAITEAGAPFIRKVHLFDQFVGKNVPQGKRSLAFSLEYQKDSSTFTDEEVSGVQSKVGETLKNRFRAEFR